MAQEPGLKGRLRVAFANRYSERRNATDLWVEVSGAKSHHGYVYGTYRQSGLGVERLNWSGDPSFFWRNSELSDVIEKERESVREQYRELGYRIVKARKDVGE